MVQFMEAAKRAIATTHIEVCDDIAAHLKRDSSNFLTDVGLQSFNGLWVVVVHPLLQVPP